MTDAAVFFFEEGPAPMTLRAVRGRPVLYWTVRRLGQEGVSRFFAAAPSALAEEIRACFPADAALTVSDRHEDLMSFLDASGQTAVFARSALPVRAAGVGFVYAAPGPALAETWRVRMTNAVQDAILLPGWVPVYNPETAAELEPLFDPEAEELL